MSTALITGATSGIGAAFTRALAARVHDLVLVARDAGRLQEAATGLVERYGIRVDVLPADLAVPADVARVAVRLADDTDPVDLLVNNAGFGMTTSLLDADLSEQERALDVMCRAVLILGGAAGRAMRARKRGTIINIASLAAYIAQGGYSAVKAWVLAYSEGLANELHGTGVTVTCVCPGWVRTEFHERAGIRTTALPEWIWVDADRLVGEVLADAGHGRVISVPTKRWKLTKFVSRHVPRVAIRFGSRMLSKSRA